MRDYLYLLAFLFAFDSECMQRGRKEVGGIDWIFFQNQWDQQRMYLVHHFPDYHTEFNWSDIISKTSENVEENEEAKKYIFGETSNVDWNQIEEAAINGDSLSQYCLSKYFYLQMSKLINGEKNLCCRIGSMFLVIAYYKGKQDLCKEDIRQYISRYGLSDLKTFDGNFFNEASKLVNGMK